MFHLSLACSDLLRVSAADWYSIFVSPPIHSLFLVFISRSSTVLSLLSHVRGLVCVTSCVWCSHHDCCVLSLLHTILPFCTALILSCCRHVFVSSFILPFIHSIRSFACLLLFARPFWLYAYHVPWLAAVVIFTPLSLFV